jgi:CHAT domain-containing protein/SIR2-like protein
MTGSVDLEIGLHRRYGDSWTIELHCSLPDEDVEVRLVRDGPSFDLDQLRGLRYDDAAYGRLLSQSLFAVDDVRRLFDRARAVAEAQDLPLRLRLFIGPGASGLHQLRWETLRDPDNDVPLLMSERVLFSRYLSSLDWRPVGVRPRTTLRALVVVANPTDVTAYRPDGRSLAPLDVTAELDRARSALGPIQTTELASGGSATLENLATSLRDGYDILFLVCHGFLAKEEPQLLLETEAGTVDRVSGTVVVDRLRELQKPPRLVVLSACQSAGSGDDLHSDDQGELAALGPRLAEAGIPAVLGVQGNVAVRTLTAFMPVFFRELRRDGRIDRAMAAARGAVRFRPDWWAPVLFMRLKSGRIWYSPGFARGFEKWPALLADLRQGRCTPILGLGLTDAVLGSRRDLAWRWSSTYHFPLEPHQREDLPHVAQFLAVNQNYRFPNEALRRWLSQELLDRYGKDLPRGIGGGSLDELMTAVGDLRRRTDQADPHKILAGLPFPVYITTHPANVLSAALAGEGKQPQVELCRWNDEFEWPPSVYDTEPDYRPSPARPLVYHLFGNLQLTDSYVLTEDDHFDYLIGVTSNKGLIPPVVRRALSDTALLFLGFRLDEWDFRVLFRSIMSQEGGRRRGKYSHVAVQIDPEESRTLEPERARRYIESYFYGADISIFWGSVEDFVQELQRLWQREVAA